MDKAAHTMIENLHKNTGKTLQQWIDIVKEQNFAKHGEIVKFLKEKHEFTHGFANLVAHKANESDAGSAENQDDLIIKQYKAERAKTARKIGSCYHFQCNVFPQNKYYKHQRN